MADDKKPSINITRGKRKKRPSKKQSESSSSAKKDAAWRIPTGLDDVASQVGGTARNVWLAGLGALSVVGEQGEKLFGALVQEGKRWEQQRRDDAKAALKAAQEQPKKAKEALDEQVVRRVQERTDDVLERVGLPTKEALDSLKRQVDDLAVKADRLHAKLEKKQRDDASS